MNDLMNAIIKEVLLISVIVLVALGLIIYGYCWCVREDKLSPIMVGVLLVFLCSYYLFFQEESSTINRILILKHVQNGGICTIKWVDEGQTGDNLIGVEWGSRKGNFRFFSPRESLRASENFDLNTVNRIRWSPQPAH